MNIKETMMLSEVKGFISRESELKEHAQLLKKLINESINIINNEITETILSATQTIPDREETSFLVFKHKETGEQVSVSSPQEALHFLMSKTHPKEWEANEKA